MIKDNTGKGESERYLLESSGSEIAYFVNRPIEVYPDSHSREPDRGSYSTPSDVKMVEPGNGERNTIRTEQYNEQIQDIIDKAPGGAAEVWLFGSRAGGTARKDSDWDIGILVPGEENWKRLREESDLIQLEFDLLCSGGGHYKTHLMIRREDWVENTSLVYQIRSGVRLK